MPVLIDHDHADLVVTEERAIVEYLATSYDLGMLGPGRAVVAIGH